jgi:hypothetical protein
MRLSNQAGEGHALMVTEEELEQIKAMLAAKIGPDCNGDHCGMCADNKAAIEGHDGPKVTIALQLWKDTCHDRQFLAERVKRLEHLVEQHRAARMSAEVAKNQAEAESSELRLRLRTEAALRKDYRHTIARGIEALRGE